MTNLRCALRKALLMIARDDTYFSCLGVVFGYNAIVKFSGWNTEELSDSGSWFYYDYNAKRVHQMFMDDHITTEKGHASTVKNADSWFVEIWDATREVSFSTKSYIIAVDSYDLDEEELVVLSDELQIWEE